MSWFCSCRPATKVTKKKKLKINVHRPVGSRVVFDDDGNSLPPLARVADTKSDNIALDQGKVTYLIAPEFSWFKLLLFSD